MPNIVKYRIIKAAPEDETFIVTRIRRKGQEMRFTTETDENGAEISARRATPQPTVNPISDDGVIAIGKQSGLPAKDIIILETDEGLTEAGIAELNAGRPTTRPITLSRETFTAPISLKGF